jgi:hypothetical protein
MQNRKEEQKPDSEDKTLKKTRLSEFGVSGDGSRKVLVPTPRKKSSARKSSLVHDFGVKQKINDLTRGRGKKSLIHFTMPLPFSNYAILACTEYEKGRGEDKRRDPALDNKKMIFIDPQVLALEKPKNHGEYPQKNLDFLHQMASGTHPRYTLQDNEWITIDYNTAMAKDHWQAQVFADKSRKNNYLYKDNLHYVVAVQARAGLRNWIREYEKLEPIMQEHPEKILAVGGWLMMKNRKINAINDNFFRYLENKAHLFNWIHFYTPGLSVVKHYFPRLIQLGIQISIDSTKFRFADEYLTYKYDTRYIPPPTQMNGIDLSEEYFKNYIGRIEESGIKVIY